jgi:16S rRNA processing protein RimM
VNMDLIAIGRIAKPIGTRGEVKILPLTDDTKRFEDLRSVLVGSEENASVQVKVVSVRIDAKQAVFCLDGFDSVEKAESLRDQFIFVPKENKVRLHEGSYFIDDVLGCRVITEEQKYVGIVIDLLKFPANDIWVIKSDEKEILIPAVKAMIRQVDVANKRITISDLEGLIE